LIKPPYCIETVLYHYSTRTPASSRKRRQSFPSALCTYVPLALTQVAAAISSKDVEMWSVIHCSMKLSRSEHRSTVSNCKLSTSMNPHYLSKFRETSASDE
jgi:hypothetical protein